MMREGFSLTPAPESEMLLFGGGESGQTSRARGVAVNDEAINTTTTTVLNLSSASSYSYSYAAAASSSSSSRNHNWAAELAAGFLENDDVDTTLRLCPPGSITIMNEKKSNLLEPIHTNDDADADADTDDPMMIYDPTPLRWSPPALHYSPEMNKQAEKFPTSDDQQNNNKIKKKKKKKRSREHDADAEASEVEKKKKCKKKVILLSDKNDEEDDEDQRPLVPIEEIARLKRMVELESDAAASAAVFLYKKTLKESDVKKDQHRLLITRRHRQKFIDFLGAEEATAVVQGKGLQGILAVDSTGNLYAGLAFKRWASSDAMVIKSGWNNIVVANDAQKGDVVEVWGFKHKLVKVDDEDEDKEGKNHKSALAFHFRKQQQKKIINGAAAAAAADDDDHQSLLPTQSGSSHALPNTIGATTDFATSS